MTIEQERKSGTAKTAAAKAPGKIILIGEHFVVLGAPALAMAVDLHSSARARVDGSIHGFEVEVSIPTSLIGQNSERELLKPEGLLKPLRAAAMVALDGTKKELGARVDVECGIPVGAGLGSSASTSVAIIASVLAASGGKLPSMRKIFRLAYTPERLIHNKPSGVDQATSTYGGIIQYSYPDHVEHVNARKDLPLLICDSGVHRSTGRLVGAVVDRSKRGEDKEKYRSRVKLVGQITRRARRALETEDLDELGWLMNWNQDLLERIGVSHPRLEYLIRMARESGAVGAKLTGAGGGGCIIALCEDEQARKTVARRLGRVEGARIYSAGLAREGVRLVSLKN